MGGRGGSSGMAKSSEEISLNKRFKRYDYKGHAIYNLGGGFAVYNFNKPAAPVDQGGKNKSHVVFYNNTLKGAKTKIDVSEKYIAEKRKKKSKK